MNPALNPDAARFARRASFSHQGSLPSYPTSSGLPAFYHPPSPSGAGFYEPSLGGLGRSGVQSGRDPGNNLFGGRVPHSPGALSMSYHNRGGPTSTGGGPGYLQTDPRRRGSVQGRNNAGISLSSLGLYNNDADYSNQDEEELYSEMNEIFGVGLFSE